MALSSQRLDPWETGRAWYAHTKDKTSHKNVTYLSAFYVVGCFETSIKMEHLKMEHLKMGWPLTNRIGAIYRSLGPISMEGKQASSFSMSADAAVPLSEGVCHRPA